MLERIDRNLLNTAQKAVLKDGFALCPSCHKPLAEPLGGNGYAAVWCRKCRKNIIVFCKTGKKSTEEN